MPESVVEQSQKPQGGLMPLLYDQHNAHIQFNPVQDQASQLWATLSEEDTAIVYQQAASKTWKLLKQTIALLVFLFVALVALTVWIWGIGFRSGVQFRQWLEVEHPTSDEVMAAFIKILVWPFERAFEWADWFVKNYLGWEFQPEQPKPDETPTPTPTPTPAPPADKTT